MKSSGIFGPKLSGKTTLAKAISREYWVKGKKRSLVLDPHQEVWGDQAMVFTDEAVFWENVWKTQDSVIIVEEAAATIRREKNLIPVFTRMRHNGHDLIVIGHSGMDLLPVMRQQIDTIYLFRQPKSAATVWAECMTEDGLLDSVNLNQYEFIFHQLYSKPQKMKLKKP